MNDDIVLAFYPEIAEIIDQNDDMAATARSVELPFDELQSVVVIRQYDDYSKIPTQDVLPGGRLGICVRVVVIQGRMDDNEEDIFFDIHAGYAPITESPPSMARGRPQVHMKDTKWINLENYKKNASVITTFKYNLFDRPGFDLLCDWATQQSRQWLMNTHLGIRIGVLDMTKH